MVKSCESIFGGNLMRAALLVIAGLALAGFIAVSFVLPQMAGSEAKEAAQALVAGADAAKQQVAAAAGKAPMARRELVPGVAMSKAQVAACAELAPAAWILATV
mgnify:CR=1 FL=1